MCCALGNIETLRSIITWVGAESSRYILLAGFGAPQQQAAPSINQPSGPPGLRLGFTGPPGQRPPGPGQPGPPAQRLGFTGPPAQGPQGFGQPGQPGVRPPGLGQPGLGSTTPPGVHVAQSLGSFVNNRAYSAERSWVLQSQDFSKDLRMLYTSFAALPSLSLT